MRLHQLKIKNLASLRGEHVINFDELAGNDLFAITGETGAGKSTLLNAISLSLYGRVWKKQLIQTDLVTLGEREASIGLRFSVQGKMYLATWATTVRKKDGSLLSSPRTERFFYEGAQGSERILDRPPEEVLSLDFDQFCKCVVLNQGEFARFLGAGFAERRDILERLYPSDNIDALSSIARRKMDEAMQSSQQLDVQLHTLMGDTLFDPTAAKAEGERHQEIARKAEEKLSLLRPRLQTLSDLLTHARYHQSARLHLQEAQEISRQRISTANAAMTLWSERRESLEKSLAHWDKERPILEGHAREELLLREKRKEKDNLTQARVALEKREADIHARLQQQKIKGLELQQTLARLDSTRHYPSVSDWQGLDKAQMEKLALDEARSMEAHLHLQEAQKDAEERGKSLRRSETEAKEKHTALSEGAVATPAERAQDLERLRTELAQLEALLLARQQKTQEKNTFEAEVQRLTPQIAKLKLEVDLEKTQLALLDLRAHLLAHGQAGEDCPICTRPFPEELWLALQAQWKQEGVSPTRATLEGKQRELNEGSVRLEHATREFNRLTQELNSASTHKIPDELKSKLKEQQNRHEALLALETTLQQTGKLLEESRLHWSTAQSKTAAAEDRWKSAVAAGQSWLDRFGAQLGLKAQWNAQTRTHLSGDQENWRQGQEARREITRLEKEALEHESEWQRLKTERLKLQGLESSVLQEVDQRTNLLKELYPTTSPDAQLKSREKELKDEQGKAQLLQQDYQQKKSLQDEARARVESIQEQLQKLDVQFARARDGSGIETAIQEAETILTPLMRKIEEEVQATELELRQAHERVTTLKTMLETDAKRRERVALLRAEEEKAKQEVARWRRLSDVLGQDDMRSYVLGLVEAALVRQTNLELAKLCGGRYEIQHNVRKGRFIPEFMVIDRWRDGLLRKVSTLSGGETFMVSLAMALALAEMARGRADIDGFFIDEGFGTLDEDSLEDVMGMLQQVRSRGKQIGLITHVKALSTRLPVNLALKKDAHGNSTVGVVWN